MKIAGRSTCRRPGLTIVAVMLALSILVILCGVMLRTTAVRRLAARDSERRLQAEWLAESGLERGLARLAADPAYKGETWSLTPADLGRPAGHTPAEAARVAITVESTPSHDSRILNVVALYPLDQPVRARASRQLEIPTQSPLGAVR